MDDAKLNKNKKTIWGVTLAFILPLVLAMFFFQWVLNFGPGSTTNYGDLISPLRTVSTSDDNRTLFRGKWSYVVFAKKCSKRCAEQLKTAETVRVLAHKNMRRVQTIFVTTEPLAEQYVPNNTGISDIQSVVVDTTQYAQLEKKFVEQGDLIFLVDPSGMAMMVYRSDKRDVKQMLRDLKRLLKYSRIG